MDIKAPPEKYDAVTRVRCDLDAVRRSVYLLQNSGVAHEFRTTFAPELTAEDVVGAAELARGTERYFLQQYRPAPGGGPARASPLLRAGDGPRAVREAIGVCQVRGPVGRRRRRAAAVARLQIRFDEAHDESSQYFR